MGTEKAEAMYDLFVKKMREQYKPELVKGMHSLKGFLSLETNVI